MKTRSFAFKKLTCFENVRPRPCVFRYMRVPRDSPIRNGFRYDCHISEYGCTHFNTGRETYAGIKIIYSYFIWPFLDDCNISAFASSELFV